VIFLYDRWKFGEYGSRFYIEELLILQNMIINILSKNAPETAATQQQSRMNDIGVDSVNA